VLGVLVARRIPRNALRGGRPANRGSVTGRRDGFHRLRSVLGSGGYFPDSKAVAT
jgi:hypothetical protein